MNENPYQAPEATYIAPTFSPANDPFTIRQIHINHEASVRSIGGLYYLGALLCSIATISAAYHTVTKLGMDPADVAAMEVGVGESAAMIILCGASAAALGAGGYGLRKLKSLGRVISIILSAIGLIAFPVGTIINGYILYLLLSPKGSMIFSPTYREIISFTPGVKCRTSTVVWAVLGIFLVLVAIGIVNAIRISAGPSH